jgi:hypothetical protein
MRHVVYVAAALVAAGCSSVQVRSTPAPGANLAARHTFAFMTPVRPDSRAAQLQQSPAGQQIQSQIARDLIDKGYAPAPAGVQPDVLVAYRVRLRPRTEVQSVGYPGPGWGWGWGWGWGGWAWEGSDVTVREYTEGTLIVDFIDPRSHDVLWRGTATGVVAHPDNPNLGKVARAVDKVMDRFPSSQLAGASRPRA